MDQRDAEALVDGLVSRVAIHKKVVLIATAALVAVLLAVWGYSFWSEKQDVKAAAALYDLQKKETALLGDTPLVKLEELKTSNPQALAELMAGYKAAADQYGSTKSGRFLHFYLAGLLVDTAQYIDAMTHYEIFMKQFSMNSPYRAMVLNAMAFAAEKQGRLEQAADYLKQAQAATANPQKEFTLYALGRLEEKMGKADLAKERYAEITKDFASSPLAARARERQFALDAGAR